MPDQDCHFCKEPLSENKEENAPLLVEEYIPSEEKGDMASVELQMYVAHVKCVPQNEWFFDDFQHVWRQNTNPAGWSNKENYIRSIIAERASTLILQAADNIGSGEGKDPAAYVQAIDRLEEMFYVEALLINIPPADANGWSEEKRGDLVARECMKRDIRTQFEAQELKPEPQSFEDVEKIYAEHAAKHPKTRLRLPDRNAVEKLAELGMNGFAEVVSSMKQIIRTEELVSSGKMTFDQAQSRVLLEDEVRREMKI